MGNVYMLAYGLMRFALEFFRGDGVGDLLAGLNTAQWLCLAMIGVSIGTWVWDVMRFAELRRSGYDEQRTKEQEREAI